MKTHTFYRYAGWLGTVAAKYEEDGKLLDAVPSIQEAGHRLAAVAGTSTCHIVQVPISPSHSEVMITDFKAQRYRVHKVSLSMAYGVPTRYITHYHSCHFLTACSKRQDPIISGWWMNEGGQSSTGQVHLTLLFF